MMQDRFCIATGNNASSQVRKAPSWPGSRTDVNFYSCTPPRTRGPTCTSWAHLKPFLFQLLSVEDVIACMDLFIGTPS